MTTSTVLKDRSILQRGTWATGAAPFEVDPSSYGFARAELGDLLGGAPALNAELATAILSGEKGPRHDFVLLNAGAALVVAGLVATIKSGIELAASVLDTGAAAACLESLVTSRRR